MRAVTAAADDSFFPPLIVKTQLRFVLRVGGLVTGTSALRPDHSRFGPMRCPGGRELCIRCIESRIRDLVT